jgi:hypothetical protein
MKALVLHVKSLDQTVTEFTALTYLTVSGVFHQEFGRRSEIVREHE